MTSLPKPVITQVGSYLMDQEAKEARTLNKAWYEGLKPVIGKVIVYDETKVQDEGSYKEFLVKYGIYAKEVVLKGIKTLAVKMLYDNCSKARVLTVEFRAQSEKKQALMNTLLIAKKLKKLKAASFGGDLTKPMTKALLPIIQRVVQLKLHFAFEKLSDGMPELARITSNSVRFFTAISNTMSGAEGLACALLVFPNLESHHQAGYTNVDADYFSFTYDVKAQVFRRFNLTHPPHKVLLDMVREDDLEYFAELKEEPSKKVYTPESHIRHFKFFDHFSLNDRTRDVTHPDLPLQSIWMVLDAGDEVINRTFGSLSKIKHAAMEITGNFERYKFVQKTYQCRSFYLKVHGKPPHAYLDWLLDCFPKLEDLYIPKDSPIKPLTFEQGKSFKKLQRIFSYEDHSLLFWRNIKACSPNLFQINLRPNSPMRPRLMKTFPDLLLGYFDCPPHFQSPINKLTEDGTFERSPDEYQNFHYRREDAMGEDTSGNSTKVTVKHAVKRH